jgi:hypothetical protein
MQLCAIICNQRVDFYACRSTRSSEVVSSIVSRRLGQFRTADLPAIELLRRRRYDSIAEALEDLLPECRIELTDIRATEWPAS